MVLFSLLLSFAFSLRNTLREQQQQQSEKDEEEGGHHGQQRTPLKNADVGLKMTVFAMVKVWDVLYCRLEDATLGLGEAGY